MAHLSNPEFQALAVQPKLLAIPREIMDFQHTSLLSFQGAKRTWRRPLQSIGNAGGHADNPGALPRIPC